MSITFSEVFDQTVAEAEALREQWTKVRFTIGELLDGEEFEQERQNLAKLDQDLREGVNSFINEIRHPTVTFATTGTTSSGKSALVNLLCGAEIMPRAVQEMSAGVVTIYHDKLRFLKIHETDGAKWPCGEWPNPEDAQINACLKDCMATFNELRGTPNEPICPRAELHYPVRTLSNALLPDLPPGATYRLMDLPGLKFIGDDGNAAVIKRCREALCIVTYNASETDPKRTQNLLEQVVAQVKELGGSPARMLFVLNRIDAYRANPGCWKADEEAAVQGATAGIRQVLREHLEEYAAEIDCLRIVRLSTWPALLAYQMQFGDENERRSAAQDLDRHFNFLVPDELSEQLALPRSAARWTFHQIEQVGREAWKEAYADEFFRHLNAHVQHNFAELVIPQAVDRFKAAAGWAAAEWALQTSNAALNSSKEKYQEETERIERIRNHLREFLEVADSRLRKPFQDIRTVVEKQPDNAVFQIQVTVTELMGTAPYSSLPGEGLHPLYRWRDELFQEISKTLDKVARAIEAGNAEFSASPIENLPCHVVELLASNCRQLINLGFTGDQAMNGWHFQAKTESEKRELHALNEAMNSLASTLKIIVECVLDRAAKRELPRMFDAVERLFSCHLANIQDEFSKVAMGLGTQMPTTRLKMVPREFEFGFKFKAGFPIRTGEWVETVRTPRPKTGIGPWLYKLFTGKDSVVVETSYETRTSENADMPSTVDMMEAWMQQAKNSEPAIVQQFVEWLLAQLESLKEEIRSVQDQILDRYREKLDRAHENIQLDYESVVKRWTPIFEHAKVLESQLLKLGRARNKDVSTASAVIDEV